MKRLTCLLILVALGLGEVIAQDQVKDFETQSQSEIYKRASQHFQQGKYRATLIELDSILSLQSSNQKLDKTKLGLIYYWKGICHNRLQEFAEAIQNFDLALTNDYSPVDLHYEYGQALFAADKLSEARLQFKESLRKKFKRAVSLYYIAFISRELGERKKAITFFKAINKLESTETKEVLQAAEAQIGDIYLEQVEKHPDSFRSVESYVIPQYQRAVAVDRNSTLASTIKDKILNLQKRYDLILLKLRNGRPTLMPPYFLKLATEVGMDSNVTFTPTEQEVSESNKQSPFARVDSIGRYTFYVQDMISIAPEFRFNMTRYLNRKPDIHRNDNYLIAPAIRTAYEHELWKRPASFLVDYDFSLIERDIEAQEKLKQASQSHTLMLGERFNYFEAGESIIRLRRRVFRSYNAAFNSTSTSLTYEQIKNFKENILLFYSNFDMTRVEDAVYNTNSLTLRGDLVMARVRDWFTPSFGLGVTYTDPFNNANRGKEFLFNPSGRISKTFKNNWRSNLKVDYQKYTSEDEVNFAYTKYIYSFELEYVF